MNDPKMPKINNPEPLPPTVVEEIIEEIQKEQERPVFEGDFSCEPCLEPVGFIQLVETSGDLVIEQPTYRLPGRFVMHGGSLFERVSHHYEDNYYHGRFCRIDFEDQPFYLSF